jgi:uncharacterized protein (DUF4415 family)
MSDLKPKRQPKPLTDEDGEVRELTLADFRQMKPVGEAMPELIEEFRRKAGRPKIAEPKVHIGFRLAPDVVDSIKASGPGYNARVEIVLRETFVPTLKAKAAGIKTGGPVELSESIRAPRTADVGGKASKKAKVKRPKSDAA